MHKTAAKSKATQIQVRRLADNGIKSCKFIVVAFRIGTSNAGKETVYRRVWSCSFKDEAQTRVKSAAKAGYVYVVLATAEGTILETIGDHDTKNRWLGQRKKVNKDADWLLSGTYAEREFNGRISAKEEHDRNKRAARRILEGCQ